MPCAAPVLTSAEISCYKHHRTRPCKNARTGTRKQGAISKVKRLGRPPVTLDSFFYRSKQLNKRAKSKSR